ncbi:hypothetical protein FOIG_16964, partial [Fusarium odoratissimum NRRL 54006]
VKRTEKIGLKDFLYNRRVPGITSNRCPSGSDRQTNRSARPLALPSTSPTPGPGTRTTPRTKQSPEVIERAQSSRQGNQVHRTDSDPWAISGSRPE